MEELETKKQIKNIGWTLGNDCPCKCKHCYSMSVREKGKNVFKKKYLKLLEKYKMQLTELYIKRGYIYDEFFGRN